MRQYEDNTATLQLKKLNEMQSITNATEKTSSNVNMEELVEPEKLQELVTKSTKKETKQLQQKVSNLTSELKELKELLTKKIAGATLAPYNRTGAPISPCKRQPKQKGGPTTHLLTRETHLLAQQLQPRKDKEIRTARKTTLHVQGTKKGRNRMVRQGQKTKPINWTPT